MNVLERSGKLKTFFSQVFAGKKNRWLIFFGIAGMALILASGMIPAKNNPKVGAAVEQETPQQYAERMEARLADIIGSIDGVGKCKVMVTTQTGVEYVYAVQESTNANETNSYDGNEVKKQTQQQNVEQKYIIVDAGSGKKEALLQTLREPTIQGVVVVCEGAGNAIVKERVTEVVATALGIPYNKVCVTKIDK